QRSDGVGESGAVSGGGEGEPAARAVERVSGCDSGHLVAHRGIAHGGVAEGVDDMGVPVAHHAESVGDGRGESVGNTGDNGGHDDPSSAYREMESVYVSRPAVGSSSAPFPSAPASCC